MEQGVVSGDGDQVGLRLFGQEAFGKVQLGLFCGWILSKSDCSPATAFRVLGMYFFRVSLSFIRLLIVFVFIE